MDLWGCNVDSSSSTTGFGLSGLQRFLALFLYSTHGHDVVRGYRILLVQARLLIIKLSFPFLSSNLLTQEEFARWLLS